MDMVLAQCLFRTTLLLPLTLIPPPYGLRPIAIGRPLSYRLRPPVAQCLCVDWGNNLIMANASAVAAAAAVVVAGGGWVDE